MAGNNETTTRFRVDISELKKAMQDARRQVANANSEFNAVASSMDDWRKSSDGLTAKLNQLRSNLESQEAVLREYENALEEVKREYGENSNEAIEYQTRLNNQQAVVNRIRREMSEYEVALREVSEAEEIAARTGREVSEVLADTGEEAEAAGDGFTIFKGAVATFVGNALTSLVSGLKDAVANMITFGDEFDKAINKFQASTGATAEEMAEFEGVMKSVYDGNYGESFDDIAASMSEIKRVAGDIGADELETMTINAITLRDTFDFEVSESMRAVNSLMDQFGIASEEAFNLMAQGAQDGLNQNGDLLDVINEYSVHFKSAGYSAEDMFNMLANGVENGTWSVDKLGDAVKEFNIRMSDGSAKDAVEALGFSFEGVSEVWREGGDEAKEIFNMLINELDGMEDSVEGYGIGVGLLGTMFEDLGFDAVYALSETEGEIKKTRDALGQIDSTRYDSLGDALQGIGRNLQTGILMPISEKILPIVSDLATKFSEWLNDPATQQAITDLTDKISQFVDDGLAAIKEGVQWYLSNKDSIVSSLAAIGSALAVLGAAYFIQNFSSIISGFQTWASSTKLAAAAQWLLNAAINANPIGLLLTVIISVVAAIATFIATNDEARAKFLEIWGKITDGIKEFVGNIKTFFTETIPAFFSELPGKIWTWLVDTVNKIIQWKDEMVEKALEMASNFLNNVVTFFKELPAKVGSFLYDMLTTIVATMIAIPILAYQKGKEFLENLILFFKQLPEKLGTWLVNTINRVQQWKDNMIIKAKEAATNFINNLIEFIKGLPEKIWTWLVNTITKIVQWKDNMVTEAQAAASNFINKIIEFIKSLPEKIWTWLVNTVNKIIEWKNDLGQKAREAGQELLDKLIEKAKEIPDNIKKVGGDIVSGLWNGISDKFKWLTDKLKEFAGDVTDKLKEFFGINSPSKVIADEVGKWLPEGLAVGITDNAKSAINAMKNLAVDTVSGARSGLNATANNLSGGAVGGVVNNFTQVINSPKQLSRLEIYRQSKNLLGYAGGGA